MKTINKQFDCVKMKNDIQAKIYSEIKDFSSEEILNYFNKNNRDKIKRPVRKIPHAVKE